MKVKEIRKKIIVNFSISTALLLVLSAIFYYKINQSAIGNKKIEQIKQQTAKIKNDTENILERVESIKRYKESWKTIPDNKKITSGIKIDEINSKLSKTAAKHEITNQKIQITLPEEMKGGIFECKTVNVVSSIVQITFNALTDTRAMLFMSELTNSLPGYIVIDKVEIRRFKKYTEQDLFDISSGKDNGAIEAQIKFYWYSYKEKPAN
ncbi:MAG: hypothetical protein FJ368_07020 [Pelagibacterales bacterium]|nr:hypothetical protein [Pelagibacterales bacterium]